MPPCVVNSSTPLGDLLEACKKIVFAKRLLSIVKFVKNQNILVELLKTFSVHVIVECVFGNHHFKF